MKGFCLKNYREYWQKKLAISCDRTGRMIDDLICSELNITLAELLSSIHSQESSIFLDDAQKNQLDLKLIRLEKGEPLAYLTGDTQFMGLNFFLNRDVLMPHINKNLII